MKRFAGRTEATQATQATDDPEATDRPKTARHRKPRGIARASTSARLLLVAAATGGLNGGVSSVSIVWTNPLSGMPANVTANIVTSCITGLMSGFAAGYTGVISYRRKVRKAALAAAAEKTEATGAETVLTGPR